MHSTEKGEVREHLIKYFVALLHEGVSIHKLLLPRFKETIRAAADYNTVDLEVEEALMLGVTRSTDHLR